MAWPLVVEALGAPRGKGSARTDRLKNGMRVTHRDPKTAAYEDNLQVQAERAMNGRVPLDMDLRVIGEAHFPFLKSWSAKQRNAALLGTLRPAKKPDWDNIAKAICDACNAVVWRDDAQIVDGRVIKLYSERPLLRIKVWPAKTVLLPSPPVISVSRQHSLTGPIQ